jgi:hypothetical protein
MTTRHVLAALGFAGAALACADDPAASLLDPPPDGQGIQLAMTTRIAAGTEREHCVFVKAPDHPIWVSRDEVRFTEGSHHVLVYETAYDLIPTVDDDGRAVDTSTVFDCSDGPTAGWSVTRLIAGSQNGGGDSLLAFPDGVAMPVRAGAVLMINAHYVNATDRDLEPEVRVNLWTVPEASVTTEGDILFLYNPLIKVPAGGASSARMRCPVHQDITIANAQSHMHARGVGYQARVDDGVPFYQNDRWADVPVARFPGGLEVSAGSMLDYHCDYQSDGAVDVWQGPRSTDEMCMLIGSYYPADPRIANCLDVSGTRLGGEWPGVGTATCAATLGCVLDGVGAGDPVPVITECMLAADPAVAHEASAAITCLIAAGDPEQECGAELSACQAR